MVLNRSWGARGHPFAQHSSCPTVLRCSIGITVAAFLGTIFVCESCFLAQWLVSHRTRQQGGVVTPPKSFAHRTRRCALSLWRRKISRKQNLRHIFRRCVSRKYDTATSARASRLPLKNGCCHFFLTLQPSASASRCVRASVRSLRSLSSS